MAHKELDLRERRRIEDLPNAKLPVSRIAAEIGRHRSTVHREIKRNAFGADTEEVACLGGYYGMVALRKASDRRARGRKLIRLSELRGGGRPPQQAHETDHALPGRRLRSNLPRGARS